MLYQIEDEQSSFNIVHKLMQENLWTEEYTRRVMMEYKRFVFLAMYAGHQVTPSIDVDIVWHAHILYTKDYFDEFCGKVLNGYVLHHGPSKGGKAEANKYTDLYKETLRSYIRLFQINFPEDIWPPSIVRFNTRLVTIDTSKWIIIKINAYPKLTRLIRKFL